MSAERAKAFLKSRACPASEGISLGQNHRFPHTKAEILARHIGSCEFCAAEESLTSAFAQTEQEHKPAEMLAHLRRLVEALLIGKVKDSQKDRTRRNSLTRTGFRILNYPSCQGCVELTGRSSSLG